MAGQIELQTVRKRELGEIIGDAFKIFFKNFKIYTQGFLFFVMPLFLLLSFTIISIGGEALNKIVTNDTIGLLGDPMSLLKGFGILYVGLFLNYVVAYTMVYSGLKAYRENGDEPFTFDQLKFNFLRYIIPVIGTYFIIVALMLLLIFLPIFLFGMISPALAGLGMFIIIPLVMYIAIIVSLIPFIRVEEEIGFMDGYNRAKYLIKDNWWSVFGVMFVTALIAGLIAMIFNIPYLVITAGATFGGIGGEEGVESIGLMLALSYLLGIIGGLFTSIYTQISIGLKYYDLVEKKDNTQLLNKIDSLGKSQESFFENEGEY